MDDERSPVGLAAVVSALAGEWDSVDDDMIEVVAARRSVVDRPAPDLG